MQRYNNFIVGRIDTNIGSLLRSDAAVIMQFPFVMITSIDSSTDVAGIASSYGILDRFAGSSLLGCSLVVRGDQVAELSLKFNLFNGFDELWCFRESPQTPKPHGLWIVAPFNFHDEEIPPLLATWMTESGCKLGLGDGIGLNYATPEIQIAERLERL